MAERADPKAVRATILGMLHRASASHLGSSMSMVEMLLAVYQSCDVEKIRAGHADRDRVFVSKGHGACATYAVMHHVGLLTREEIDSYHQNGSLLAGHVSHSVPGVEHSTGALGHGLSVACGCAIGLKARGSAAKVYALLGDGEIQEGSVWEAVMLAAHHKLSNLTLLVDNNRISSITQTAEVLDLNPLTDRFASFGFRAIEVDGHCLSALDAALGSKTEELPTAIICNTTKGKGVEFAENDPIWHYRPLSDEAFANATASIKD